MCFAKVRGLNVPDAAVERVVVPEAAGLPCGIEGMVSFLKHAFRPAPQPPHGTIPRRATSRAEWLSAECR